MAYADTSRRRTRAQEQLTCTTSVLRSWLDEAGGRLCRAAADERMNGFGNGGTGSSERERGGGERAPAQRPGPAGLAPAVAGVRPRGGLRPRPAASAMAG
jgi:hypothetical protein